MWVKNIFNFNINPNPCLDKLGRLAHFWPLLEQPLDHLQLPTMATTAMALSSQSLSSPPPVPNLTTTISATQSPPNFIFHHRKSSATAIISFPQKIDRIGFSSSQSSQKWRINVSSFPAFLNNKSKDAKILKEELLEAIAPLDRGAEATPEDQKRVDQVSKFFQIFA